MRAVETSKARMSGAIRSARRTKTRPGRCDFGNGPRLTGAHQRLDRRLKVLHIRRFAFVQNDKVDGKLLHPPIFVSLQDLAGDMECFDLGYSQQHDRQIAGDALRP